MAKSQSSQPENSSDFEPILFIAVIALLAWLVWHAKHESIARWVLAARGVEIYLISFFTHDLDKLAIWASGVPRSQVTAHDLMQVSDMVGDKLRWFTVPVLLGVAVWVYVTNPRSKFMKRYNDKTLALAESVNWSHTRLFTRLNLLERPIDEGPWAASITERQYVRANRLRNANGTLDRERAETALAQQLGNLWMGHEQLRPYARAMFALFAARIAGDNDTALKLVDQYAISAADGALDFSHVDAVIAHYVRHKTVQRICDAHAYELCVLMSMYEAAKKNSPMPPNWFRWLKGADRTLWYALHNIGMRIPFVEVCGVYAHWLTERAMQKRIELPVVKKAVDGLQVALSQYTNDDEILDALDLNDEERDIPGRPTDDPRAPPSELAAARRAQEQA